MSDRTGRAFRLDEAIPVLARTPAALDALLRGLADPWIQADEGPDTWSPFVVLGHLVHGERTDWIPRARLILERGEQATFEPFDRFAQIREPPARSLPALLDLFAGLRRESLAALAGFGLVEADFARRARHPALGPVTLGELLATWVAHDLGHVAQVARAMAGRYAADVGPWREYLPILGRRR